MLLRMLCCSSAKKANDLVLIFSFKLRDFTSDFDIITKFLSISKYFYLILFNLLLIIIG